MEVVQNRDQGPILKGADRGCGGNILLGAEGIEGEGWSVAILAASPIMFVRLVGVPQHIIGDCLKFPSLGRYFIARPDVVEALLELMPHPYSTSVFQTSLRSSAGEQGGADGATDRKNSLKFVYDLQGGKFSTRNKTDLDGRERDLHFLLQALDCERREYALPNRLFVSQLIILSCLSCQ